MDNFNYDSYCGTYCGVCDKYTFTLSFLKSWIIKMVIFVFYSHFPWQQVNRS